MQQECIQLDGILDEACFRLRQWELPKARQVTSRIIRKRAWPETFAVCRFRGWAVLRAEPELRLLAAASSNNCRLLHIASRCCMLAKPKMISECCSLLVVITSAAPYSRCEELDAGRCASLPEGIRQELERRFAFL